MILLVVFTGFLYILLIGLFFWGWVKLPQYSTYSAYTPIKVSVIIAFRNEESNLTQLINSIHNQHYPSNLIEIIAINDHSTDQSYELAKSMKLTALIDLPGHKSGKKAALLEGTSIASGEIIITTDADCLPAPTWISSIVSYYQINKPLMIVAPVVLQSGTSFFSKFQEIEFLSLQGSAAGAITIKQPIMCNGANLAFSTKVLPIIRNTYNTYQTASGDDIFALLAVNRSNPGQIHYLKSPHAIVTTKSETSIFTFFQQRIRWTSKAKLYTHPFLIATSSIVLITNLILLFLLVNSIFGGNSKLFFILFLLKSIIDFPFLFSITSFFNSKKLLLWFPVFQSFYFLYISFTFVMSLFGGYTWKSRKIST